MKWWGHDQDFEGEDQIVGGEGYGGLIEALRKKVEGEGGIFKLEEEVVSIADDEGPFLSPSRSRWGVFIHPRTTETETVKIKTVSETEYDSSHVICTLPLGVLKTSVSPNSEFFDPPLPPRRTDSIARIGFGLLDKLVLHYPTPWWTDAGHSLTGIKVLIPDLEASVPGRAVPVFGHSLPDGSAALVFLLGASKGEGMEKLTDAEAAEWGMGMLAGGWRGRRTSGSMCRRRPNRRSRAGGRIASRRVLTASTLFRLHSSLIDTR